MIKFWLSPRVRRTDFFFGVLAAGVLFVAGLLALTGGLTLMVNGGFRTQFALLGREAIQVTALRVACDALTAWFVVRRIRDIGHSGRWAAALVALPLVLGEIGGVLSFLTIFALFFVPGMIGPNRFGPDPRGWRSREHYEEQERRLKSGEP